MKQYAKVTLAVTHRIAVHTALHTVFHTASHTEWLYTQHHTHHSIDTTPHTA